VAEEQELEKELPASERRLQQAREEGNIPRSRELAGGTILLGAVLILMAMSTPLVLKSQDIMRHGLILSREDAFDPFRMLNQFASMLFDSLLILLPVLAIAVVAAILSNVAIGGLIISGKGLTPDFSRLNPMKGLGNIFSVNGLFELLKAILKACVLGYVGYVLISRHADTYIAMAAMPLGESLNESASLTLFDAVVFASAFFLLVAIDVPYQLWKYYKQLRMSIQDVKKEAKDSEGDPHIKARVRALQREAARKRMMAAVPTADVVVTNPTHFSVALKYDQKKGGIPRVIAKGADDVAFKIRQIARENKVPVLEVPALARALYKHVELDREIPSTLYTVVAKLLAYVYSLAAGQGHLVQAPTESDVPPDMDPGVEGTGA
jgi:flagellar biosynthetic protein FlhB